MMEILVPRPAINTDKDRNFSSNNQRIRQLISDQCWVFTITPQTHPRVVDLCSGDGPIAQMMIGMGWHPENITCIDLCKSPSPVVQDVHWEYMNLKNLAFSLKFNWPISPEVEKYRHAFDIVTEWLGVLHGKDRSIVCNFFARPGGFILNERIAR